MNEKNSSNLSRSFKFGVFENSFDEEENSIYDEKNKKKGEKPFTLFTLFTSNDERFVVSIIQYS
jgi:hypothetical protein